MAQPSILFTTSHPQHVKMFKPIVDVLRERFGHVQCFALSTAELYGFSISRDQLQSPFFDLVWILPGWPSDLSATARWITHLCVEVQGMPILEFAANLLRRGFSQVSRRLHIRRTDARIRQILRDSNCQVLVMANDRAYPERQMAHTARMLGAKSLLVQESIRKDEAFGRKAGSRYLPSGLHTEPHGRGGSDRVAAWGGTSKDYYIRMGVKPERIQLTGNPRLDDFCMAVSRLNSERLRKANELPAKARVILLATNPIEQMGILSAEDYTASVLSVLKAVTILSDVYLIVRPHPIEVARTPEWLQSSLMDHPRILNNPRMSLAEAVVASDGVLIFNSTVALEAALADRDVGVVNLFDADYGVDFGEYDFAVPIRSRSEIIAFLSCKYLRDWQFSRRDIAAFIINVGHAAESIAVSIAQLGGFSQVA